ncbi:MAG: branched-chain amino acid ABC transporter permease [Actinomycetes bacterium]|jgi:branched-chain amino acid transport system permease protein
MLFLDTLLIGLSSGAIYALMALALVLVWRSTRVVNFAQAGQAILSTYLGYEVMSVTHNYWVSIPFAILGGAAIAAFVDAVIMRSLAKRSHKGSVSEIAPVIATLGLLGLIRSLTGMIWGNAYLQYTSPLSSKGYTIGSHTIPFSPLNLVIVVGALFVMGVFAAIFKFTNLGLALRAASFQPEISRLAGIRVDRIRTVGWAFAGAAGAVAGALVTPTTYLSPNSLDLLLVSGFVAAVIGGLDSLIGAVLGGLLLGVGFAFILQYIGTSVTFSAAFIILILVLFVRPRGILGSKVGRRDA